jgi:thiamine-monophosphate kinase
MLPTVPLREKALIAQIRRMAARRGAPRVAAGIGDDCAVLRLAARHESLITTDFSLEGIHFRRQWHPPECVGHRCLARGLSDIAAMGGEPVAAFLSLALPGDVPQAWVNRFLHGLLSLAKRYRITLAGGDTAESPDGVLADIVVVGTVPTDKAILRSGARPGDRIYVSGALGGSAAAVLQFQSMGRRMGHRERPRLHQRADTSLRQKPDPLTYPRHFSPEPRIELGRILREKRLATAMIDTSDGLSTDLAHICEESKVGAEIGADLIPRARVGKPAREVSLELALHGGEDYELLFTAPASKRIPAQIAAVPLTCIGVITRSRVPAIFLRTAEGISQLAIHGWEHFRR